MSDQPKRLLIIGAGAQAKYALESIAAAPRIEVAGICALGEPEPAEALAAAYGTRMLGRWDDVRRESRIPADGFLVCCADPDRKAALFALARERRLQPSSVVHPRATIATTATLGAGSIVNAGAVIQPFARVGVGAMIHANVVVEHDCSLADFVNLAPGARLAGWVSVGRGAVVYTGASVIPQISIGAASVVGAGAAVIRDVPDGCTVAGVPARIIGRQAPGPGAS